VLNREHNLSLGSNMEEKNFEGQEKISNLHSVI